MTNMHRIFATICLMLLMHPVFAQPPVNDDPCNAIELLNNGSCNFQIFTTDQATASAGVPLPGCAAYSGADVWFKLTVPCNGSILLDTDQGDISDGGMAIYSGTCNNLTLIDCDDNSSANGNMPSITATNLTPGATIWIRFWAKGNNVSGTFGICFTTPPPPPPGGNCASASPFCTSNVYTFPNNTNQPDPPETSPGMYGCLFTQPNPVYYYMQIQNAGNLTIDIQQTNAGGSTIDVDFICWGPFSDISNICNNSSTGLSASTIVDCSYSSSGTETCVIPNAQVGEFYVLLLTNFSNSSGTITFQLNNGSSTGTTNCAVICNITASAPSSVCTGQSFNLSSDLPGANYTWTGPNCFTSSLQNPTGVIAPTVPGTYTYIVNAVTTSGEACTATVPVIVGGLSGGTATPQNTSCLGTTDGGITINPPTPGSYVYTLSPPVGPSVTNNTGIFSGLSSGIYSATYATGGCVGTISNINVTDGAAPTTTASIASTTCLGSSDGIITVSPPSIPGIISYTLNPGSITQNNPVFSGLAAGNNYIISFSSLSNGCSGQVSPSNIVVPSGPSLSTVVTSNNPACAGINNGNITFSNLFPNVPGNVVYTLTPGGTQNNNPVFSNLSPGNYNYIITNSIGCTKTGSISMVTNPAMSFQTPAIIMPLCNGGNDGNASMTTTGGVAPYEYSINGGVNWQSNNNITGLAAGNYSVNVRDAEGCQTTGTFTVSEPSLLTASAQSPSPATCRGNDGHIDLTANGGTPGYTYSIDGGLNYQNSPNFIVSGGNYNLIKIKDNNNCIASASVNVSIIDNMIVNPIPDQTICAESSTSLLPDFSPEATVFEWTTIPYNDVLMSSISDTTIKNPVVSPIDTTTYSVTAHWGMCTRQDIIKVNVLHKPIPDAGRDTTVCDYKKDGLLIGHAYDVSGPVLYSWTPSQTVQNPTQALTLATPDSTQTYTLTVKDDYGCNFSVSDNVIIFVRNPVPAFAGKDTIAALGLPHQLLGSGGVLYEWKSTSPLNPFTSFLQKPYVTLYNDQMFTLKVTDVIGCIGQDSVFVKVYEGPRYYSPSAFTPNGDGLNDIFRVVPSGIAYTKWFKIYNRYGNIVFQTNTWMQGWDGKWKGKKQPTGTYVWEVSGIDRNGKVVEESGTVILIN